MTTSVSSILHSIGDGTYITTQITHVMERSIFNCTRTLSRCLRTAPQRPIAPANPLRASSRQTVETPARCLHTTPAMCLQSKPPKTRDRGPKSDEDTQTDFGALDVLRNTVAPATSIDACTSDGFALNNQMRITGCGIMLLGGEAFRWRPWITEGRRPGSVGEGALGDDAMTGKLVNSRGQWDVRESSWGVLELAHPKPDLLVIGTGPTVMPIAPAVRRYLNDLGIRLEIQDTRNAAAQFNLLATERGVGQVAAALIPIGWREQ
jgi:NADH dehydrogenase [ubiquinone] 1 alpha subcomplex assembly factor 3